MALDLESLSSSERGSAPGERTKIIGVFMVESAKLFARSKGGGEIYFFPSSGKS